MFASNQENSILRGLDARLSGIRAALSLTTPDETPPTTSTVAAPPLLQAALEPFLRDEESSNNNNDDSQVLLSSQPFYQDYVKLSWQMENDDDEEEEEEEPSSFSSSASCVAGYLVVTRQSLLFCCSGNNNNNKNGENHDWYVPAASITLHALTGPDQEEQGDSSSSSAGGVYIQLEHPDDESCSPIEWTVKCRGDALSLYTALSQLVSLHPIDPHEDTNNNDDDDEHFEPDDMIWASHNDDMPREATADERQAMLDRLDQILIVPPELEIPQDNIVGEGTEGQFDDAEDDDDDDQML